MYGNILLLLANPDENEESNLSLSRYTVWFRLSRPRPEVSGRARRRLYTRGNRYIQANKGNKAGGEK